MRHPLYFARIPKNSFPCYFATFLYRYSYGFIGLHRKHIYQPSPPVCGHLSCIVPKIRDCGQILIITSFFIAQPLPLRPIECSALASLVESNAFFCSWKKLTQLVYSSVTFFYDLNKTYYQVMIGHLLSSVP